MERPHEEPARHRLGDWSVDADAGTLRRGSEVRRLEPRVMAVLLALVRRRGRVVSRESLLAEVWTDIHVHEIALTRCVSELRKALGDDPRAPRYIETLPKRGYRLVAPVLPVGEAAAPAPGRPAWMGVAAILVLVAGIAIVAASSRERAAPGTTPSAAASAPAVELYERGVAFYERYRYRDNENALVLLRAALDRDPGLHPARAALADALAMKARHESYDPELVDRAIEVAMEACAAAPELPEAHKALGLALSTRGWLARAAAAYTRALALRPEYDAARTNLAAVQWHRGRRDEALRMALGAGEIDSATAAANLGTMLEGLGLTALADRWYERAVELEPNREVTVVDLALRDAVAGRIDEARRRLRALEAVVTDCTPCLLARAEIEYRAGNPAAAASSARAYFDRRPGWRPGQLYMVLALRLTEPGRAAELLARAEQEARAYAASGTESWWAPWSLAAIAALRGDRAGALRSLEGAVAAGYLDARALERHPLFAALHGVPEFERLVDRMRRSVEEQRRRVRASAGFPDLYPAGLPESVH